MNGVGVKVRVRVKKRNQLVLGLDLVLETNTKATKETRPFAAKDMESRINTIARGLMFNIHCILRP
jgi:hypothetical protein